MFQFILELVTTPAVILGLMALVGLLVQRKSAGEVISGTLKTILGVLIMSVGI
jgi:PTS system ascorbate-specific IIC component